MQFYTKRKSSLSTSMVPMIDILIILLIFFIVNTQWKKPSSLMKIEVPSVEFMKGDAEDKPMVTMSIGRNGDLLFDEESLEFSELTERLKKFREEFPNIPMKMEADKEISLETLIKVWDSLTAAGIEIKTVPALINVQEKTDNESPSDTE